MVKVSDWVTTKHGGRGIVKRLSKRSGKVWADVNWGGYVKRMPVESLIVETTIDIGDGWTVTDITREQELKGAK